MVLICECGYSDYLVPSESLMFEWVCQRCGRVYDGVTEELLRGPACGDY